MAESNKEFFKDIKNEFKDLGTKVNKLFDELVRGKAETAPYEAKADVYETETHVVFELDLPGFDRKDIGIQIRDNQLVVRGSRIRDSDDDITVLHRERVFGDFERSFSLPVSTDVENVSAKFEGGNGILVISLPKEVVEVEETTVIDID